jgi:hypothetical protein
MRALADVTKKKKRKKNKKEQRTRKTRQTNGLQKNVHHGPKPNIANGRILGAASSAHQEISDPSRVLQRTKPKPNHHGASQI